MGAMETIPAIPLSDNDRWRRVLARDRASDGAFVYAVRSTGIFCRPSCASRRPLRVHVRFFADPKEARRSGFRPCRRCRPEVASDPRRTLVARICKTLAQSTESIPTLAQLAETFKMSPFHLQRVFKAAAGVSPRAYAATLRLSRLKASLKNGEPVTGALYEAGFGSSSRLYEMAPAALGMTPASYARGGRGTAISYTIGTCPLGRILVAATARGIAMVSLGDSDAELEGALRGEFPHALIARDDASLKSWLASVLRSLESGEPDANLPLDVRATAFERRVWQALRAIPKGETRSYGEIATAIGKPTAARAVGHACGRNPVALVVPCHRAVGAGGKLTGYRWGVARKRRLLAREQGTRRS